MLASMTGIGRYTADIQGYSFTWEVRSVNHKYLDTRWRIPQFLRAYEDIFDKILRAKAKRGRVEISLEVQALTDSNSTKFLTLDISQAQAMIDELKLFAENNKLPFEANLNTFLSIPSLWKTQIDENDTLLKALQESLGLAIDDWNKSRQIEAKNLAQDLFEREEKMRAWVKMIENQAPQIKKDRLNQVRERVSLLLQNLESELDENRFLQETVIIADKLDISEEITRLHAHLKRFTQLLKQEEDNGRKLDFTLQECFREINTCGNKVQDIQISHIVVDFKNELEKCREQVQNIE